jgi:predicted small secreted protein
MKEKEKNNDNLNKIMKEIVESIPDINGFWITTKEGSVDWFRDDASMYQFISTAHEVENAYTSIKEEKGMERLTERKLSKSSKKKIKSEDYFG